MKYQTLITKITKRPLLSLNKQAISGRKCNENPHKYPCPILKKMLIRIMLKLHRVNKKNPCKETNVYQLNANEILDFHLSNNLTIVIIFLLRKLQ